MKMTNRIYYRRLIVGTLLILVMFFLWSLFQTPDVTLAFMTVMLTATVGISMGAAIPGILLCVVTSSCLMGYGLVVRRRYALTLFWSGFVLFFLAGMMGLGTRY